MTYAAVLVHAQADPEGRARLDCARSVADIFHAGLIGLGAEMIPPVVEGDGYYSLQADWFTAMRQRVDCNLKAAGKAFCAVADDMDCEPIWESGIQMPAPAMALASRAADLIVASHASGRHEDPYRYPAPGDLAITSGRPVLVAPSAAKPLSGQKVVLAWKDTREARRAVADAMPFLERAGEVLVLEVCEEADAIDARLRTTDVAAALKRHGVAATAKVAVHHPADGAEILRQAGLFGADLIVAGAYGHSRLGEWVFGGVTRTLLGQDDVYVLLSH